MSHAIPDPYAWNDTFAVFYNNIDDEHKAIFTCIFNCANSPSDGALIKTLYKVTDDHFREEEGMMTKANYADYPSHKKIHTEFLAKLEGMTTPLSADTLAWAKKWLVDHIITIDFKYKGKL